MSENLGMMGPTSLDRRKSRTCGSGGGCLSVCCGVGSRHCQDTELGFTVECSRKWTPYWRGSCAIIQIPAGMSRAGVCGGLFIFVQVALSTCIMQANEKTLFALRSRFLVSAYSFIFLTKSKRYFILFPMYNLQIVGLSCWYAIWSSPFFDLLNSHFSSFIRIALQKIIQPCR